MTAFDGSLQRHRRAVLLVAVVALAVASLSTTRLAVVVAAEAPALRASIEVKKPAGGETLAVNTEYTIEWESVNLDPKSRVYIYLSRGNHSATIPIVELLPAAVQQFTWTPGPQHASTDAELKVFSFDGMNFEAEGWSKSFVISAETAAPTLNSFTASPSVVLGGSITLDATVSDTGGSGLGQIKWLRGLDEHGPFTVLNTLTLGGGHGPEAASYVDTTPPIGNYWYSITVIDVAGNQYSEPNPINRTVAPSPTRIIGITGNLDFGTVQVGTSAARTMTIGNSGTAPLTVGSISYPTGFSGAFSGQIAPGGSQNVTVTFTPAAAIAYGGTITVNADYTGGTNTRSASGTGETAPTRIIALATAGGSLAFGNVATGTTATKTLTITNTGNSALSITSITYPAGFSGAFSGTISAGGSQNVTVTFAPVSLISYSGPVTVNSNQTSGTNTIGASGTGITPTRVISLSANLAFGGLPVRTAAQRTLTIFNNGNAALTVTSVSYPAGFSGAFSGSIPAGGSQNVTVTFAPTNATSYGGTVTVNSNATSGTNTIAASGSGTAAVLPPGTFLFDDFEGGGSWLADPTWAVTTEAAHSGSRAWSDSPGGNYGANVFSVLYTPVFNLTTAIEPQLRFWHRRDVAGADALWVMAFKPGVGWDQIGAYSGTDPNWTEAAFDLSDYAGFNNVQLAFIVVSDGAGAADGWYIDDVVVKNATSRLLDLNADGRGDTFVYSPTTGLWGREVVQPGGFFSEAVGGWATGWTVRSARFDTGFLTDIFLFSPTNGSWFKLLNDGTGFTTQATGAWSTVWQRHLLDLNGDGVTDVFLFNPVNGEWFKCISNNTPSGFTYFQGAWTPGWEVYPINLNGDAMEDMFLLNRASGQWVWALSGSGATFTYPVSGSWSNDLELYPGYFNSDQLADLLLVKPSTGQYWVSLNTGSGFSYVTDVFPAGWKPSVVDLDGNGIADVFLYDQASGLWVQFVGNGAGQFTRVGTGGWIPGWVLYPTDFNLDGRTDLLLYHPGTGEYYQAWNLFLGSFAYYGGQWQPGMIINVGSPFR